MTAQVKSMGNVGLNQNCLAHLLSNGHKCGTGSTQVDFIPQPPTIAKMKENAQENHEEAPVHPETGADNDTTIHTSPSQPEIAKEQPKISTSSWRDYVAYVLVVLSHVLFGMHPVFSRYLQHTVGPDQALPPLSLLVVGYLFVLAFYTPRLIYKFIRFLSSQTTHEKVNKEMAIRVLTIFKTDFLLNAKLWLFVIITIGRTITNILSSRYTSAI
jgi:hypothetical protein